MSETALRFRLRHFGCAEMSGDQGTGGNMAKRYYSEASMVVHDMARDLLEMGAISEARMREYDKLCLVKEARRPNAETLAAVREARDLMSGKAGVEWNRPPSSREELKARLTEMVYTVEPASPEECARA